MYERLFHVGIRECVTLIFYSLGGGAQILGDAQFCSQFGRSCAECIVQAEHYWCADVVCCCIRACALIGTYSQLELAAVMLPLAKKSPSECFSKISNMPV